MYTEKAQGVASYNPQYTFSSAVFGMELCHTGARIPTPLHQSPFHSDEITPRDCFKPSERQK